MYPLKYPHTISNYHGEELTFVSKKIDNGEELLILRNRVEPGTGPPFHVHFKQDESLTVIKGKMGYQIYGEEEKFLEEGQTAVFKRNEMHRFWNAGDSVLECNGWIKPANSVDYFLKGIYDSMNKAQKPEGDPFDSAFLITRYRSEYDLLVIPKFVKKVIMPITVMIGKLIGKYKHFADAPKPLK